MSRSLLVLSLVLSLGAFAQVVPEREVELARQLYEVGKFTDALKRARDAMALANFTPEQRLRLHEIAGLSAFNLGDAKAAQEHFLQLLQLNPDYQLDPFAVPPLAIKAFEQVRRDAADSLALVRQQIALRAEQEKREAAERERKRVEEEEQRRRAERLAQGVTVRTVEKHPLLLNFLPFGVGQFLQGRTGWGAAFAITEAVFAITSIISWVAIFGLYKPTSQTVCCYLSPDGGNTLTIEVRAIPPSRHGEYQAWTALKFATGAAFYATWAVGAGEALLNHKPETVTETREPIKPTAHFNLSPTSGGLGASLTIRF